MHPRLRNPPKTNSRKARRPLARSNLHRCSLQSSLLLPICPRIVRPLVGTLRQNSSLRPGQRARHHRRRRVSSHRSVTLSSRSKCSVVHPHAMRTRLRPRLPRSCRQALSDHMSMTAMRWLHLYLPVRHRARGHLCKQRSLPNPLTMSPRKSRTRRSRTRMRKMKMNTKKAVGSGRSYLLLHQARMVKTTACSTLR